MSLEAMKQALEAFKKIHEGCGFVKKDNLSKESNELATLVRKDCNFAMYALQQAIEQAEDEPRHISYACPNCHWSLDKQVRIHTPEDIKKIENKWVGLSDEEIKEIVGPWGDTSIKGYTRKLFDAIEAKLKEKNYG